MPVYLVYTKADNTPHSYTQLDAAQGKSILMIRQQLFSLPRNGLIGQDKENAKRVSSCSLAQDYGR